jgi:hypothetical protein
MARPRRPRAKQVAAALGVTVEPVETARGTAVTGLQANQFDAMFALDGPPVRTKAIDCLTIQIAWEPFTMITRLDSKRQALVAAVSPAPLAV